MKKVLLVATVQSHICQFHRPLAELLHENGYEVHVAAHNNLAEKNGLVLDFADKVFDIPLSRSPLSLSNIKAYKQLKGIIHDGDYDVIHSNTPVGGVVARLAAKTARKNGAKVIYTAHGFHFYQGAPKMNWILYYPVEKHFSRLTDTLITIAEEDRKLAEKKFYCKVERIHGVGVDGKRYFPVNDEEKKRIRSRMGYGEDRKIILCIGELLPNKNQIMALEMMKILTKDFPDALLLIAGNGSEKKNLENKITSMGLDENVEMLGYVTNLEDYQHISDVAISCSIREGLGLNVVEAMLSSTPVTATYNRGHRELIEDGKNGFLVNVGDAEKMADRIKTLFCSEELCREIIDNALVTSQKYCSDAVKEELRRIYGF